MLSPTPFAEASLSILFVEDNPADYRLFQQAFRTSHLKGRYQLSWASSYDAALKMLEDRVFDLCFVDYNLDTENGTKLVQHAKNRGQTIPFIMLTHHDRMRYVEQAMQSGVYDYILKREVTPSLLERSIRQALERHRAQAELIARKQQNKMEALGQMASGLAHELNNLLQPILFKAENIIEQSQDKTVIIEASKIVDCASKAAHIMSDVLKFSHQETEIPFDKHHLLSLFAEKTKFIQDMIPKSVQLSVGVAQDGLEEVFVQLNDTDLFRVLSNLVNNAVQAVEYKGAVQINLSQCVIKASEKAFYGLRLDDEAQTHYAKIIVQDNGGGVPMVLVDKIFNPFFTTKPVGCGTGLGLSLVQALVKSWDGSIYLDDKVEAGAAFVILLPLYSLEG
jgi:signal transduction histidine kinase